MARKCLICIKKRNYLICKKTLFDCIRAIGYYVQHNYYTLLSHANLLHGLQFLYLTIFTI